MKYLITAGAMILVTVAPMAVMAYEDIDERRDMSATGTVTVINISGDVEVSTWDQNEVHITGELAEYCTLDIKESPQGLRIEVVPDEGVERYNGTELELRVPRTVNVSVSGVSSDVTLTGLEGEFISAETVSGDLEISAEVERADLTSVSGDIEFDGESFRTSVETVSGDIELQGLSVDIEATVVSGDIDLDGGEFQRAEFESVSGSLDMSLALEHGGKLTAVAMSGDIDLRLSRDQQAEIKAQTFSGDIRSALGSPQKNDRGPGTSLSHIEGNGGATIKLENFSGDISIGH